jgi:hypothetical protein
MSLDLLQQGDVMSGRPEATLRGSRRQKPRMLPWRPRAIFFKAVVHILQLFLPCTRKEDERGDGEPPRKNQVQQYEVRGVASQSRKSG